MPLFEYRCDGCNLLFEELVKQNESAETKPCPSCGKVSNKQMSSFAPVIAGGGAAENIDMTIGREADKRWQTYHDRQSQRRGDKKLQDVPQPAAKDGKFMPVMALGGTEERTKRTEYVGALQDHRKKRIAKGLPQFSGPGEF
jgi:putative FmdB family regulatory protein